MYACIVCMLLSVETQMLVSWYPIKLWMDRIQKNIQWGVTGIHHYKKKREFKYFLCNYLGLDFSNKAKMTMVDFVQVYGRNKILVEFICKFLVIHLFFVWMLFCMYISVEKRLREGKKKYKSVSMIAICQALFARNKLFKFWSNFNIIK